MSSGVTAHGGGTERILRWRGVSEPTLELLSLRFENNRFRARSWVVGAGAEPLVVSYDCVLDGTWRTRSVSICSHLPDVRTTVVERVAETMWRVDGVHRSDLDGCVEVDLSITPFSNTLALLRLGPPPGGSGELQALYVSFPEMACVPSRQRYERLGPSTFRYVDLGVHRGFEASLTVDSEGFVRSYEGLFERIDPTRNPQITGRAS